ncbi:MAG: hypothetical protein Kow0029_07940 [Candidatus Rifleibacteriota bacterium]
MSGSGGGVAGPGKVDTAALLSGRVFFPDRQLYGGIPVTAKDLSGQRIGTVLTDSAGYFAFTELPAGIYDISALTGESEVTFAKSIQVDGVSNKQISEVQLLGVSEVLISEISSSSIKLKFRSNRVARASVEYGPVGGYQEVVTIGQAGTMLHETTLTNLSSLTDYEMTVHLTGDDGQDFTLRGLYAATTGAAGPTNLSIAINNGAYETKNQNVTLNLSATNCSEMRISESYDMSDANWVTYSETYSYTFKTATTGTKRVYIQFRDSSGNISTIQSDSILMSQTGYLGIWINDGAATTNSLYASVKTVFPGATQMMIADNSEFLNAFWEAYTENKKWTFSNGDGLKTIYCKFRGGLADPNEIFTASILLDTTAPEVSILINNKSTVTATTSVELTFSFSTTPAEMKISNTVAPTSSTPWTAFKTPISWTLEEGDGEKEVFGVFRDAAGNEYGPVSSKITLDTVPPSGNTISLHLTEDPASEVATFTLTASLPVFLHFDVTDSTTYQAQYAITEATTTEPVSFTPVSAPFTPVPLYETQLPVGIRKVWARFLDEAGNKGFIQNTSIKIVGPQIIVSPTSVKLESGDQQQFTATIKNIEMAEVGSIRWRVISGSGTIDANGLYTAPAPIYNSSEAIVRADSTLISSLYADANITLATSVEMLFQQRDGRFTYDQINDQIPPGDSFSFQIKILNSDQGYELSKAPEAGTVSISPPVSSGDGMVATLTYNAPGTAPAQNPVTIGVKSLEAPTTAAGTMTFVISTGPNIILSPTSGDAQRASPLTISASVTGTSLTTMNWSISPAGAGSFDPNDPNVLNTSTIAPDHKVVFYASSPTTIMQASVTASIDGASKSCKINVYPPIRFQIDPTATSSLPIITPITFKAQSFDYLLGTASEAVVWEFKNQARVDFMPADGKTYLDRGSLTVIDSTTAEYRRPTKLPSETDLTAMDAVIIRATSVADPVASVTAIVTITPKVVVEIFDSVEKIASITTAATVAEVGKLQFFAGVTPTVIGNTSVTWTVNGTSGSTQYGTIDSNGLYTAPDEIFVNEVTVRATSNYDPTAFAAVTVKLSDFWLAKRTNMFDSVTGEVMPVNTIMVNPYTASGSDFIVYSGTSGYGVWVATFSDVPGVTDGGYWQGIPGLSDTTKKTSGQYTIGHIAISPDKYVYAATASGIWYIPTSGTAEAISGANPGIVIPDENFLKLAFDGQHPQYLFATTPGGVYRLTLSLPQTCTEVLKVLNTTDFYKDPELESRTDSTASPPITVYAYSNTNNPNPINGTIQTIVYDDYNDRLYAGGEGGIFLYMNNTSIPNLTWIVAAHFIADAPSVATIVSGFYIPSSNQPKMSDQPLAAPPLDLALDVVNRNTIWAATVNGVFRSIDNGMTWTAKGFGTGSTVNTRAIIVDPTNTINVLSGSEDGLYRSTDAGATWKRIRSGLGNHKTITGLTQASGLAGARRKVWVSTSGGVFMGKQSLDLE